MTPLECERALAARIATNFIIRYDLTITDFTVGSDLPGPKYVGKPLKDLINKCAKRHGIRGKILRQAIYNELIQFDADLPVGDLIIYVSSADEFSPGRPPFRVVLVI